MASMLQKLIRKSPPTRIIAALRSQPSQNLSAPCILHQPLDINNKSDGHWDANLNSVSALNPSQFSQFYPSFPFGLCLPQISSTGLVPFEPDYDQQDDSRKLWADSVKKEEEAEDEQTQVQEAAEAAPEADIVALFVITKVVS